MNVYLEFLFHYQCDICEQWWSIADTVPEIGGSSTCPRCRAKNTIEGVESAESLTEADIKAIFQSVKPGAEPT